ncbi:MAG: exonuclease SbcCD subunit D C-terminal domain-containing protein [Proteobacteria bacterium]|nr:exonuclease SbcCD subunit D C-terminal domain-containing protein [Pseudomonadota bacterium]
MRIVHTSDWHLGHTLRSISRSSEHGRFLVWLADLLVAERVDALIIAGDVFDTANPPASATAALYQFLAAVKGRLPKLEIVIVGGNHDSAARLDAPSAILDAFGVHVVGGLPHRPGGLDHERLIIPLHNAEDQVEAWVAAVPFLRQVDLPHVEHGDPLIEGVREIYAGIFAAAAERRESNHALIATGHCYMVGTQLSEQSERRVLGGNQHPLPDDVFPPEVTYAALGHLHRAQSVGERDHIRYSGSPIPLSMTEVNYEHQVVLLELSGGTLLSMRPVLVPRWIEMLRIPADGPGDVDEVLDRLRALPAGDPERPPYLDVRVRLEGPRPGLRAEVDAALAFKEVRLVSLGVTYTGESQALADTSEIEHLDELDPFDVFTRRYAQKFNSEPSPELAETFRELLEDVRGGARDDEVQVELFPNFAPSGTA